MGHHDVEKWPIRAAVQGHAHPYRHPWAHKYTDLRVKKRNHPFEVSCPASPEWTGNVEWRYSLPHALLVRECALPAHTLNTQSDISHKSQLFALQVSVQFLESKEVKEELQQLRRTLRASYGPLGTYVLHYCIM